MNDEQKAAVNQSRPSELDFAVVGIGASAGGLRALTQFLEHLPAEADLALVVILHLSPKHESSIGKLLQRSTRIPVTQVAEPIRIERNNIYVISPAVDLVMDDGWLKVAPAVRPQGRHVAIDRFFRTLAEVHRDRAIGIILSGSGSDGSVGISSLREHGGVTIAQLPEDAEYEDMPRSAIATGTVDFVLPVVEMPQKTLEIVQNARQITLPFAGDEAERSIATATEPTRKDEDTLREILRILRDRTGHDFHHYKRATVLRRLERRLQITVTKDIHSYHQLLENSSDEAVALLGDLLISVTNFFRDRDAFEALERDIIPGLIANAQEPEAVRVWTAGCASGEEAYSLAMLLCDEAGRQPEPPPVQVFATDIDERAIARARAATYPDSIIADVPPMRLREYFTRDKNHYRIKKSLRDKVMFAAHNVLRDPPFSRMDLISCRNLLIYLDRDIQQRLLQTFHFALKPGGYLFLGSSESVDVASPYFDLVDKRHRIFRARGRSHSSAQVPMLPLRSGSAGLPKVQPAQTAGLAMFDIHQRALLAFSSPSLIVDSDYNVMHVSADAGRFLRFSTGEPSRNLLKVIEPALRVELRSVLFQAVSSGKEAEAIRVKVDGGPAQGVFNLSVRPFKDPETSADFLLVIFSEVKEGLVEEAIRASAPGAERVIAHLEDELQRTRDRLQSTIEQSETSTEELKASNEELQAINEELRSATEELETSKEELQSVNEELTTVNHELKSKVEEAAQINDDLRNFIASTEIATVFIDAEWRIKRYTPSAEDIFSIIPSDVGRKLLDITHRLDYPELSDDIEAAYQLLVPRQREVRAQGGRLYMVRVLPYRTGENRIDGAVLTFVDITALRQAEERARSNGWLADRLASPGDGGRWGLVVTDDNGTITGWSSGMTALLGFDAADAIGRPLAGLRASQTGTAESGGTRRYVHRDGGVWSGCGTTVKLQARHGAVELLWEPAPQPVEQDSRDEGGRRSEAMVASSLRDEFLAVMSHELKHPLNLIGINSEILGRLPEVRQSPDAVRVVETLRRAVRSQAKIIDDLLDLSRMRTGKLRLNLYPVNMAELVTTIAESAKADVSASELELELDADEPVIVCGDAQRIEQIVWNLLSNAIKFTPAGGRIRVNVRRNGAMGEISVQDTGLGIEADFLPRVFDMFGQAAARAASKQTGLGIGLALVKQLVDGHSGRIEVISSGRGQGSTFIVSLPLVKDENASTDAGDVRTADKPMEGLNILLVDDTRETVEALQALLQFEGATVVTATSGEQALALAEEHRFDLLLSDIGMPDMDGYTFVSRYRNRPENTLTPTIALSGFGSGKDVEAALAAGFTRHICKPVSLPALLDAILELTTAQRQPG